MYCLIDIISRLNEIFVVLIFNFLVSISVLIKNRKGNVPSGVPYIFQRVSSSTIYSNFLLVNDIFIVYVSGRRYFYYSNMFH